MNDLEGSLAVEEQQKADDFITSLYNQIIASSPFKSLKGSFLFKKVARNELVGIQTKFYLEMFVKTYISVHTRMISYEGGCSGESLNSYLRTWQDPT